MTIKELLNEINGKLAILEHIGPEDPGYPEIYSETEQLLNSISEQTNT